jgi:glyoxylase-like metal-dependent hydrolase (beta-lactamase superfamily II)
VSVPRQIELMKSDLRKTGGSANGSSEKTVQEAEAYLTEARQIQIALPTITVSQGLVLERKGRSVQILWLGKAHTDGDLFVFLPAEKILITGDSLQSLTPTMRDCYPADWIKTLDAAGKLDFEVALGGHGDVMHGKATFELWKEYFADLLQAASQSYAQGSSMNDTRKELVPLLLNKYASRFPPRFPETIVSNVEKAYRVASGSTE